MKILFRYQSINKYYLDALEKGCIWGASLSEMNDPHEVLMNPNLISESSDYIEFYRNVLKDAKHHMGNGLTEKEYAERMYSCNKSCVGAIPCISFSECEPTSEAELLWTHYANSHKGMCMAFGFPNDIDLDGFIYDLMNGYLDDGHSKKIIGTIKPINYVRSTKEVIESCEGRIDELAEKLVFSKPTSYAYEREYRWIPHSQSYTNIANKLFRYPCKPEAIFFGIRTSAEDIQRVKRASVRLGVSYYKLNAPRNGFEYQIKPA